MASGSPSRRPQISATTRIVFRGQLEGWVGGGGTVSEQPQGGRLCSFPVRGASAGKLQRRHQVNMLATSMQRRS